MKQAERIYKRAKIIGKDIPLKNVEFSAFDFIHRRSDGFINIEKNFTSLSCVSQINNI